MRIEQNSNIDLSVLCSSLTSEHDNINDKEDTSITSSSTTAILLIDCHNELGEGIIYDDINHCIVWTDILSKQFHMLQLPRDDDGKIGIHTVYQLPKMLGSFGLLNNITNDSNAETTTATNESKTLIVSLPLLCAWEDGFQLYDVIKDIELSKMSIGECVNPRGLPSRLNDGRVDRNGQYYICGGYYGSIDKNINTMKVYRVKQQKDEGNNNNMISIHETIINEITTTNSLCWSNDGKQMYIADSHTKKIVSYNYHDGIIDHTQPTLIRTINDDKIDAPDGSCVDNDGYIWNAIWCSGQKQSYVHRIDPNTGHVVYTVHIPYNTSQITCCCFGRLHINDPHYNVLFISTAGESTNVNNEPHAGGLFAIRLPFIGTPESKFKCYL